jgi:hypothetical protein
MRRAVAPLLLALAIVSPLVAQTAPTSGPSPLDGDASHRGKEAVRRDRRARTGGAVTWEVGCTLLDVSV